MRKMVRLVLVSSIAIVFALSASATTLHMSSSAYYDTGGTFNLGCIGLACPIPTSIGDTSGNVLFTVSTDVEFDGTNTTYNYAVQNIGITDQGNATDILAFLVLGPNFIGTAASPANWAFSGNTTIWSWLCGGDAAGAAVCGTSTGQAFPGLQGFSVTLAGEVDPTFEPIEIGLGNPLGVFGPADWVAAGPGTLVVTPTPEPASLMLLASGLMGGAFFRRRKQ